MIQFQKLSVSTVLFKLFKGGSKICIFSKDEIIHSWVSLKSDIYLMTMSWKSIRGPYFDPFKLAEFPTTAQVLQRLGLDSSTAALGGNI